jgi:hypothetical protein
MNQLRQPFSELSPEVYNAGTGQIALEKASWAAPCGAGLFAGIADQRLRLLPGDAQPSAA